MGMIVQRKKISEARYTKLVQMPPRSARVSMLEECPASWRCKGVHGIRTVEQGGEFFVEYVIGE